MIQIVKKRLPEIDKALIIDLCNNPQVRKHMPLAEGEFDDIQYEKFISAKENIWNEHGYGPWAFVVDGNFVGWGGLQPEGSDVEIVLVLHPNYWGLGGILSQEIIKHAFENYHFDSLIILFPPSRTRVKGLNKLGFSKDGQIEIDGKIFLRYRLPYYIP